MKSGIVIVTIISVLIAVFASCVKRPGQLPGPVGPASKPAASEAPQDKASLPPWGDWDKLVREAKKEGKIFWYTTMGPEDGETLAKGFTKSHGIAVERLVANGPALVARITAEKRAGLHMADLFDGGTDPWAQLRDMNYVETILVPEAMDLSTWKKDPYYLDPERKNILIFAVQVSGSIYINTTLVKPGEIESYQDLLNPKWRGKIAMDDPVLAGPGQAFFARSIVLGWVNENFWRKMAEQEIFFTPDRRELPLRLARGQSAIAIGSAENRIAPFRELGAPVSSFWLKEGGRSEAWNITLLKNGPNPNAARLFINWLVSKEGQEIMSRRLLRVSQRKDVSWELVPEEYRYPPEIKVHWTTLEDLTAGSRPDIRELARFLTGR